LNLPPGPEGEVLSGGPALQGGPASPPRSVRDTLVHGSAWVLAGKVLAAATTLASNAILARILSPEALGAYFVVATTVLFASVVGTVGGGFTTVRFVAEALATGRPARARAAVLAALKLAAAGTVVVAGVFALGLGRWASDHLFHSPLFSGVILLTAAWIAVTIFNRAETEIFRGFGAFHLAGLYDSFVSNPFTVVAFLVLWVTGVDAGVRQAVALSAAATGLMILVGIPPIVSRLRRLGRPAPGADPALAWADVMRLAWPTLVTQVGLFVLSSGIDLWIVASFRSAREVAVYGGAFRLIGFVGVPLVVLNAVVQPLVVAMHARGEKAELEHLLRGGTTLVSIPSLLVLLLFLVAGSSVMGFAYGPFYRQGATILVLLSLGQLIAVLTGPCGMTLAMTGHLRSMMSVTLAAAALSVAGALVLVRPFGPVGVAMATAAGYTLQSLLLLLEAKRRLGIWTHAGVRVRGAWRAIGASG
jgi:O-antigen/teichoic acid export membrane protein